MIFTDRKITIRNSKSSINEPVILYRGDYEVSIKFTIMESKFRFKSEVNLVDSEKASFGQLAILAPYGGNVFSEVVKCEDGTVTFTLTKEMIDQLEEVGLYSFQIRLFDYYVESRVSIPPVEFGIEVREPVASEDHDNEVNNAIVGYSIAKIVDGLNEDVPDTFDADGQYNKTDWKTGDRISQGKLNKIEDAIDKMNQNEKADVAALDKRVTSNFKVLDSTKADKNQVFSMVNMGQDVKEAMTGGSVAVVGDNTILENNIVDGQITQRKLGKDVLKLKEVNLINEVYEGYFVNWENGELVVNSDYRYTDYIFFNPDTIIYCSCATHHSFYDINRNFITGVQSPDTFSTTINEIVMPKNAYYIRLSTKVSKDKFMLSYSNYFTMANNYILSKEFNGREIELEGQWINSPSHIANFIINKSHVDDTICTLVPGVNKFNPDRTTAGCINWTNGGWLPNTEEIYVTSNYIDVLPGETIYMNYKSHYMFLDSDYSYITGNRGTEAPDPLIVPDNARYIRVSVQLSAVNPSLFMLTRDEPITEFIRYGLELDETNGDIIIKSINKIENISKAEQSRFYGKKVSWYGTSITQGYSWCKLVNNYFNFDATNNGVGGTAISKENENSSMCTQNRMLGKYSSVTDPNNGQVTLTGTPIPSDVEVIFIEGGTNDWARNWAIGDKEFTENPNDETFAGACHLMFKNMTELFPNAEIIIVGSPFGKMPNRDRFTNKYGVLNNQNLQTVEYGDILLDIAGKWGIKGFNMGRAMQIHDNNVATFIPDGLHLTTDAAKQRAADAIIAYLLTL